MKKLLLSACLLSAMTAAQAQVNETRTYLVDKNSEMKAMTQVYADGAWTTAPDGWTAVDFDDSSWATKTLPMGDFLEGDQLWAAAEDGTAKDGFYLRKEFNLDAVNSQANYVLLLAHDDDCEVFLNGTSLVHYTGSTTGDNYRVLPIDGSLLKAGKNVLAINIRNLGWGAYIGAAVAELEYDVTTPFAGVEPTSDSGSFYLYNPATGMWLQNNDRIANDLYSRAELGTRGIDFKMSKRSDGHWYINGLFYKDDYTHSLNHANRQMADSSTDHWELTPVKVNGADKAYRISFGSGHDKGFTENDYTLGVTTKTITNCNNIFRPTENADKYLTSVRSDMDGGCLWIFVTEEQRRAMLASATVENPENITWLIKSADMGQKNTRKSAWTASKFDNWASYDTDNSRGTEVLYGYDRSSSKFSQTIANLPAGRYTLNMQALYREGGNFDDGNQSIGMVSENRLNFTEKRNAYLFAGDRKQPIMNILDEGHEKVSDVFIYSYADYPEGGYTPGNAIDGVKESYLRAFNTYCAYDDNVMTFYHAGGDLTIGIGKDVRPYRGDFLALSKVALQYEGAATEAEVNAAVLQAVIDEAEAFTGEVAAAYDLEGEIAAAKAALSGDAAGMLTAAENLKEMYRKVNLMSVRFTPAKRLVDICREQNVDNDADFAAAIDAVETNIPTASTIGEINYGGLVTARKVYAVDKHDDVFTTADPEDGKSYYLYNVASKRFLTGGCEYGTHTAVNFAAMPVTLEYDDVTGGFAIHTNIRKSQDYLSHDGYVDTAESALWFFEKQDNGTYIICKNDNNFNEGLLGYSAERHNSWTYVSPGNTTENSTPADNQWKLVTKEQRDELLKTATASAPQDATYYITAAGFDHHVNSAQMAEFPSSVWEMSAGSIGGWESDYVFEAYNTPEFDLAQTLEGLPAGYYVLSAQGFFRHGKTDNQVADVQAGTVVRDQAYIYALTNDYNDFTQTFLPAITDEADKAPGEGVMTAVGEIPGSRDNAALFFENGLYKVTLPIFCTEDGVIMIGAGKDVKTVDNDWVVLDNFRLTYYGTDQTATGIETITTSPSVDGHYNLLGQRVTSTGSATGYKGIMIVNGKKVIKK